MPDRAWAKLLLAAGALPTAGRSQRSNSLELSGEARAFRQTRRFYELTEQQGLLSDWRRRTPALQNSKTAAIKDVRKGSQEISSKRARIKSLWDQYPPLPVHLSSGVTCRNHPSHLSLSSKAQLGASVRDPALTEGGPSGASVNESPALINGLKTNNDIRRVRQPRPQLPLSLTPRRDTELKGDSRQGADNSYYETRWVTAKSVTSTTPGWRDKDPQGSPQSGRASNKSTLFTTCLETFCIIFFGQIRREIY